MEGLPEAQEAATDALTALAPAKGWDPQTLGVEKSRLTALSAVDEVAHIDVRVRRAGRETWMQLSSSDVMLHAPDMPCCFRRIERALTTEDAVGRRRLRGTSGNHSDLPSRPLPRFCRLLAALLEGDSLEDR